MDRKPANKNRPVKAKLFISILGWAGVLLLSTCALYWLFGGWNFGYHIS